ncbi:ORF MSV017 hypothetical protein [Melanoplus sanguinipes entomopoxvirus]|uniref:Uncharacterized protein n=1 Tax=Melanoplus sanguinipes entomopoxvirus TaxID=83191 RepID=Q9YW74_MSEPV|nr:ORF MSV017 hypothetical protein [Melanoplus sanguinipes entomopoxvirus]AAC97612.1 ORF MSV017 hypothetical protein [Melanoplus sanguinipes entomopoxvirus 'O']
MQSNTTIDTGRLHLSMFEFMSLCPISNLIKLFNFSKNLKSLIILHEQLKSISLSDNLILDKSVILLRNIFNNSKLNKFSINLIFDILHSLQYNFFNDCGNSQSQILELIFSDISNISRLDNISKNLKSEMLHCIQYNCFNDFGKLHS